MHKCYEWQFLSVITNPVLELRQTFSANILSVGSTYH